MMNISLKYIGLSKFGKKINNYVAVFVKKFLPLQE